MDLKWIELPENPGKAKVTINEDARLIAFAEIMNDPDLGNPCDEQDGLGKMHSFGNRHANFVNPLTLLDDDGSMITFLKDHPDVVLLSYFEHGQCLWGVLGTMNDMPDFQWDGVGTAGYWEPDQCLIQEVEGLAPEARREKMELFAKQACEIYTYWYNGEAYGYSVKVYKLRQEGEDVFDDEDDYRFDDPVFEDSCWGYYGWDEVERAVNDIIGNPTSMAGL